LNSGIFCSFDSREWNLNLNSLDCGALKIICVDVWVDGYSATNFPHRSKYAQENYTSFDTNLIGAVGRRKKAWPKNCQKWILRGLKLRGLSLNPIIFRIFVMFEWKIEWFTWILCNCSCVTGNFAWVGTTVLSDICWDWVNYILLSDNLIECQKSVVIHSAGDGVFWCIVTPHQIVSVKVSSESSTSSWCF